MNITINEDLWREIITGLKANGGEAALETIEKLNDLWMDAALSSTKDSTAQLDVLDWLNKFSKKSA